ncbi:MAG: PEP-CTERM sorting domain-containing protein [Puniceicoccales bacterium]
MKIITPPSRVVFTTVSLAFAFSSALSGASVVYDTVGSTYTQNFDTLSNNNDSTNVWSDGNTLTGWHWVDASGTTRTSYLATSGGSVGQNIILSAGNTGTTDRSLGAQSETGTSDTDFIHYGLQLTNDTGSTLDSFSIAFTAEQWRAVNNEGQDQLSFSYQVFSGAGDLTSGSWTNVASLTFDAPTTVTTGSTALDGNDAANQEVFSTLTLNGIGWDDGEELWLRWSDVEATSAGGFLRAVMTIDDVSFSASSPIPEPSSYSLLVGLVAGGAFMIRRRR